LKEVTLEKDRLAGLEVIYSSPNRRRTDRQDELDAMKTSARMRSVSQSVQPEDPPSAKKQKTAPAKPKERTKRQPSIVQEEVESDVEEPVAEKPKKKAAPKPVVEKKAKENKPVAPRLTVRKVSNIYLHRVLD
jgi:outer membrane biosynthesis protein TonB